MDSRISVDSLRLWLHIKHQYSNAHIALLDAQLPTSTYRDLCIQHIHHYIDSLFAIAKPNLRVNGRNFEDLNENDQEIEPFDEALDRHIWSLSDQRLKWDREIARTRTEKPREVETMLRDLFDRQREAQTQDMVVDNKDKIKDEPLEERLAQVEQVFKKASALSEELNQSIPIQSERSHRVKTVMKEVKALKP
ncbi:hypothetical protein PILCRDRAFT_9343 [Piloderma croceum F 1598]|uniref:Uncharacterized protein n=1 Tax=Piloderma croceum (strain F 1598) TaxID=765440 RepID=A0A0C3F891_PILCF|nr:hypothetical protein PILCRDRAFT_9343 [Piloderma croceum F 1598]